MTAGAVFNITVPLTVGLMSVLGGTRHWAGPALGATAITLLLYASTSAEHAVVGKAVTGAILVGAVLFMPEGLLGRRRKPGTTANPSAPPRKRVERAPPPPPRAAFVDVPAGQPLLVVRGLCKAFSGVRALDGVDLDVRAGEILGILGP